MGKGGGAYLSRPAANIMLHDVYLAMVSCPALITHACDDKAVCVVAKNMGRDTTRSGVGIGIETLTLGDLVSEYVTRKK